MLTVGMSSSGSLRILSICVDVLCTQGSIIYHIACMKKRLDIVIVAMQ